MLRGRHYIDTAHYTELARTASQICARNRINAYPLNPMKLADKSGIKILTYEKFAEISGNSSADLLRISEDGFSISQNGAGVVVYNKAIQSRGRRRWTLLHEMSHIYLGHIDDNRPQLYELSEDEQRWLEADADDLAACLIAPLFIAHLCNVETAQELRSLFGVSQEAAEYFLNDLQYMRQGNRIARLVFPESAILCLPFISEWLSKKMERTRILPQNAKTDINIFGDERAIR